MDKVNCSKCNTSVDKLDLFSNNLCLDCYRVSEKANRDITADELVAMFKGSVS
jgi:protein-arginine kinase activator protein McsA